MINAVDSGRNLKAYGRAEGSSMTDEDILMMAYERVRRRARKEESWLLKQGAYISTYLFEKMIRSQVLTYLTTPRGRRRALKGPGDT